MSLDVRSDHVIVENPSPCTAEKIQTIVQSAGFCPLIFENKINEKFAFTIVPYTLPDFFIAQHGSINNYQIDPTYNIDSSSTLDNIRETEISYFSMEEITQLLENNTFIDIHEDDISQDKWSMVNNFRSFVSPALNQGLSEIISKNSKGSHPLVEIGSGIGYSISDKLSSRIVRIQPTHSECKLLSKSTSSPIYKMNIEDLYNTLSNSGKKIPLFFALDVFDTMTPDVRQTSILQISKLQNPGDSTLILLDTNPCLDVTVRQLENLYPDSAIFPYFLLGKTCDKFSVIIVPLEFISSKPSVKDLVEMIEMESQIHMRGQLSRLQYQLHQLQKEKNLKVLSLEDFFVEQTQKDLEQVGYKTNVYYHASFTSGSPPNEISEIKQDLIYKAVTDSATVRQWSLNDKNLLRYLAKKNLNLPRDFDEIYLQNLREDGKKIFGAEILVIEAVKI